MRREDALWVVAAYAVIAAAAAVIGLAAWAVSAFE